ncbi:hypothetical protein FQA39_LY02469 [Lamprigera yunnana]|nr:hypothetical protein FQA39_LY02469 [Lamprigera yunnana]
MAPVKSEKVTVPIIIWKIRKQQSIPEVDLVYVENPGNHFGRNATIQPVIEETPRCGIECETDLSPHTKGPHDRIMVEECNQLVTSTSQDFHCENECPYDIEHVESTRQMKKMFYKLYLASIYFRHFRRTKVPDRKKNFSNRSIILSNFYWTETWADGLYNYPYEIFEGREKGVKKFFLATMHAMLLNNAIVLGTISTGISHSQCEQLLAYMDVHFMSFGTYEQCHQNVGE